MRLTSPEQVLQTYKNAVEQKDLKAYIGLYHNQISIFDMWGPQWTVEDSLVWQHSTEEWFGSLGEEKVRVESEEVQVRVTAQMSFLTAILKYSAVSPDQKILRYLYNRLTWVLEPFDGSLKITHQHTSAPIDHASLLASLKR